MQWGTYWGEGGFAKIKMGGKNLGVEKSCSWGTPVQMQLGNVMRASQEALSNAERHHEKIVNDVRDDVEQNFDDQAHAMA